MEKLTKNESIPAESQLMRMQERMEGTDISNKEDFWKLVIDLSVDYPDYSRSHIAETLMNREGNIPEEIVGDIDDQRVEMNKYDLVVEDLNQMPLENESEYRRMLDHLAQSRNLSKELIRSAILQECRIDSDLRDFIESEEVSTPSAFTSNLNARSAKFANVENDQEAEKKSISARVVEALRDRIQGGEYLRELEALEGIEAAVSDGRNTYELEAKAAGKDGYIFVQEVLVRMDNLDMAKYPDLVEKISVAVTTEVEQGRDAEGLRSVQFDSEDKVLNTAAQYVAMALHKKMTSS